MSNVVKNQHYVPQFYLNYFTNKKNQLFVYDKFESKGFPSNARNIASEGYFYDVIKGKMQYIETYQNTEYEEAFSNFLPNFIDKIKHQRYFKLKKYEKVEIASYLSYQYIRTKRFREESARLFTSPDLYNSPAYFPPQTGHLILLSDPLLLKDINENLMQNYYWIVGKNSTDKNFYTSDHPFVQRESLREVHRRYNKQFADFSLLSYEISFPLTPKFIITFYNKKYYKGLRHYDRKVIECDKDNVDWFNNMQFIKSYRQIYSQNNDFSFIEKLVKVNNKNEFQESGDL